MLPTSHGMVLTRTECNNASSAHFKNKKHKHAASTQVTVLKRATFICRTPNGRFNRKISLLEG